jgi:starch-binding outer membrane protein, SusD/RagB family
MKKIFFLIIFSIALLTSCSDYLNVVPVGQATTADIWRTAAQAQNYVYTLYGNIPDLSYCGTPGMPDLCAGGDMITGWYGSTRYFPWKSIVYNNQETSSSTYFKLWDPNCAGPTGSTSYSIYNSIRNCYYFLDNIKSVPDITDDDLKHWSGEAYFLIAFYHQLLLEYYGPVILMKRETSLNANASEIYLARDPYDSCVNFIADKYKQAIDSLPATQTSDQYGRATAATAYGYLARLMLYAASPLVNGNTEFYSDFKNKDGKYLINQTYDANKWKLAMDAAKEAITYCEANGYQLYTNPSGDNLSDFNRGKLNYHSTFVGTGTGSFWNSSEILFGQSSQNSIDYNAKNMGPRIGYTSYTTAGFREYLIPTWDCVESYYSKNGLPMDVDPETKNLNLYSMASGDSTALLNRNREPRFYASIGYDRGLYEINGGTISIHARYKEPQGYNGVSSNEYQSNNGYFCQKYISKLDTYKVTTTTFSYNKFVYPYLRVAELYLDYAEAEFEYTGTLSSYGLDCLNKIRHRAGLPNFEDSWAKVGGIPTGDALRQVIHQERTNEFLMESRRYHDIRRWKIAKTEMMRQPKSWTLTGNTAATYYNVTNMYENMTRTFTTPQSYWLAIPIHAMTANYNLVQNPGY